MNEAEIAHQIALRVFGPEPRYRYFQKRNGPMFSWLVEPIEGAYASFVHVPRGKGARSDRAGMWVMEERLTAIHDRRRDAKARALRLYQAVNDHGCTIADLLDGSYLEKTRDEVTS